jgi:hypothetical protein
LKVSESPYVPRDLFETSTIISLGEAHWTAPNVFVVEFRIVGNSFKRIEHHQLKTSDCGCQAELDRAAPLKAACLDNATFHFGREGDNRTNKRENFCLGVLTSNLRRRAVYPVNELKPRRECEWATVE